MTSKDIVEMYKKGYSINYIIKEWYRYRIRNDIPNHKFKNTYIITKKSVSMKTVEKDVYDILFETLRSGSIASKYLEKF